MIGADGCILSLLSRVGDFGRARYSRSGARDPNNLRDIAVLLTTSRQLVLPQ